ncbi:MAG: methylamine utilization protein [Nitrosomonadales bacterium]|nr:methylamine utilization protein [Nitrosomonadales bacterium]
MRNLIVDKYILLVGLLFAWMDMSGAGELQAFVKDQNGKPVEDAVVLATPLDGSHVQMLKQQRNEVDQIDKEYVPHVKVVLVGSNVLFPNKDNIRHHVYSFSPGKVFELPLYSGTPAAPVQFDKAGPVTLGCNIHDWMLGYIYVADTPFYGKSAKDGKTHIVDVPPGDYSVRVWHPDMKGSEESTSRKATVDATAVTTMEWQLTLKPVFRIPRVSGGAGSAY